MTQLSLEASERSRRGARFLFVCVALGMSFLIVRLWFLQVVRGGAYQAKHDRQSVRLIRVPAPRGGIYDRNGVPLVKNHLTFHLQLYLQEIRPYFTERYHELRRERAAEYAAVEGRTARRRWRENLEKEARYQVVRDFVHRATALTGDPKTVDRRTFERHYRQRLALPFPIGGALTRAQVARFLEAAEPPPGVNLDVQSARDFRFGERASHLLGYVRRRDRPEDEDERDYDFHYLTPDYGRGQSGFGVEWVFDDDLRGRAGARAMKVTNLGYRAEESVVEPPLPGADVHLALDLFVQDGVEQALRMRDAETKGAVVVMDVRNGDILALASNPTFDPSDFIPRMPSDLYAHLNHEDRLSFLNRATYGRYPPGSVFKIIVSIAGLESGLLNPNRVFHFPRTYFERSGHRIGDTAPPGPYNFERAFKLSSNQYFITHGLDIGRTSLVDWSTKLGLGGEETGIPTNQEIGGYLPPRVGGFKRNGLRWRWGDTANLSIGQGDILVTPIQIASMVAAVANGGRLYRPRLVTRVEPKDVAATQRKVFEPELRRRVAISDRTLGLLRAAMRADVAHGPSALGGAGSGYPSEVPGMEVCGKTGTAEVDGNPKVKKITWFASFAPLSAPRYAVVVMVVNGASGRITCAPIARRIYERLQEREAMTDEEARERMTGGAR